MVTATLDAPAKAGFERMQRDPAGWITEFLGADLWEKQIEIAESVRDHRRTAVKSCHGSGKSYLSARIVIWFLHAFPGSMVLTTAPTNNQVENILWRELRSAAAAKRKPLLGGKPLNVRYDIAPDWYALGFKAADTEPDRFQGFHSTYPLVVIDEAAGVAPTVYEALDAVMTAENARMLLIGNPTNPAGMFYDAFHSDRSLYNLITIAASDTPNIKAGRTIRPYLITQQWIDDVVTKFGEDSAYVQSRVHAQFPRTGVDTLIPLGWAEAAANRSELIDWTSTNTVEAGVDVARTGTDESVITLRCGVDVLGFQAWNGYDLMQSVGRIRSVVDPYREAGRLGKIKVDSIGMGAGVADRLRELGYDVVDVNVSTSSSDPEKWPNLRHELWWELRELFHRNEINGVTDETTIGQLTSVKYGFDSRHSMPIIESKEQMKKRGLRSPDRAESLMLAFANIEQAAGWDHLTPDDLARIWGGR
jgi:phage terminase large subunit